MGNTPRKEGTLILDCASERPSRSISTTAKSLLSRVTVEKAVRCSVVPASSTIETRRDQRMLSAIGSKRAVGVVFVSIRIIHRTTNL